MKTTITLEFHTNDDVEEYITALADRFVNDRDQKVIKSFTMSSVDTQEDYTSVHMFCCKNRCHKVFWDDSRGTWPCGKFLTYNQHRGTYQII